MEYWIQQIDRSNKYANCNLNDRCYCEECGRNDVQLPHEVQPPPDVLRGIQDLPVAVPIQPVTDVTAIVAVSGQSVKRQPDPKPNKPNKRACRAPRVTAVVQPPILPAPAPMAFPTWPFSFPFFGMPPVPPPMPAWGGIQRTRRPAAQHQVCCNNFLRWACTPRRNGRPPHNHNCRNFDYVLQQYFDIQDISEIQEL